MIHELVDQVNAVIDGEIVAFDADGRNSFETLQQRMNLRNEREIERVRRRIPVTLVVVRPAVARRTRHHRASPRGATRAPRADRRGGRPAAAMSYVEGDGTAFVEAARALRPRGRGGQAAGVAVRPGQRRHDWRKIKLRLDPGLRDPGMDAGSGRPGGELRRAAGGRDRRRHDAVGRPGRHRVQPPDAGPADGTARAARARRSPRSTTHRCARSRGPGSWSRSSSARSSTWR